LNTLYRNRRQLSWRDVVQGTTPGRRRRGCHSWITLKRGLDCDWRRQYERQLIYTTGENWFVVQPILGSRMAEEEEEEEEEQEV